MHCGNVPQFRPWGFTNIYFQVQRLDMYTKFWSGNLEGREHLGHLGVREDNIKMDLKDILKAQDRVQ
jgi:hypothetical protein